MKSGIVFGTASMLDGLTERMEKDFGRKVVSTIATGGLSKEIISNCTRDIIYNENLILDGLKYIYDRNNK
jgi:type III pantothenate kinase